jgi:photosynthetic reaction center H subunit
MGQGITQYIDVAQIVLYLFWAFFAGLIYYLARENHREGYPMETVNGRGVITGWPVPEPKIYLLANGEEVSIPNDKVSPQRLLAEPSHGWAGAPLVPTGINPMLDGVGPGAWADRADVPDVTCDGDVRIVPLRSVPQFNVSKNDTDPRGMPIIGDDGVVGGTVVDLWVDTPENLFRYIEVELADDARRVLVPMNFVRLRRTEVKVNAILGSQFAAVPVTRHPEQVTLLEEEKIMAYFGAGTLYAEPSRAEPLV